MKDLMIDIETLGTKPGCVVLSIAACGFNIETGDVNTIFIQNIDIDSSVEKGLKIEANTVIWWLKQSKEAQRKITESHCNKLGNVLRRFGIWIYDYFPKEVRVWGNSARFDLGILEAAYDACNLKLPWNHYNECDVRTLVMFAPEIKKSTKFEGIPHYGIDDCKHQIKYCSKIYKTLKTNTHD